MVDRNVLRTPCMASTGRRKRQTNLQDLVHLNRTLITRALIGSQASIQSVRRVNLSSLHGKLAAVFISVYSCAYF